MGRISPIRIGVISLALATALAATSGSAQDPAASSGLLSVAGSDFALDPAPPAPPARMLYYTLIEIPREQIAERISTVAARRAAASVAADDPVQAVDQALLLERRLIALEAELKSLTEEIVKRLEP